jgi:hexulose-6-phosphate isomerase
MIKCISYWSIQTPDGSPNLIEDAFGLVRDAGFDGIELTIGEDGPLTPETSREVCEKYRESAEQHGLELKTLASAMSFKYSPTSSDASVRRKSIDLHRAALQRASWLGAEAMLYVPGAVKIPWNDSYGPVRYDHAIDRARAAVTELATTAAECGVVLCIENVWNGMFYSPLELADFVDGFKSEHVKIYFDCGNVLGHHQHPPHWIELLGKRIRAVHVKDVRGVENSGWEWCGLLTGDVPWNETMSALKGIDYDGTVVAELAPLDAEGLKTTSDAMDRLFAM